jgi:hypothetical protein
MKALRRKGLLVGLVLLVAAELAYVWGANALLRSGQIFEWVNHRPERLLLRFEHAWTPLPGLVFIEGFSIVGQDGPIRWSVEVPRIRTWISLSSFALRTLRTYGVTGEGGRVAVERVEALLEVAPEKMASELATEATPEPSKRSPFKFDFHGIDLEGLERLSLFDYSYEGLLSVGGAFALTPGQRLRIGSGLIAFERGRVLLEGRELSRQLEGEIDASIDTWLPQQEGPERLFDLLSADVRLGGVLEDASFLRYYLRSISWLKLLGVSGEFAVDAKIRDGAFEAPTHVGLKATSMGAGLGDAYVARGSGEASWAVEEGPGDPSLSMNFELHDYRAFDQLRDFPVARGRLLRMTADSRDLELRKVFSDISDLSATLDLSKVEVTDLRFINNFVPASAELEITSGAASLEAKLHVSTRHAAPESFVRLAGQNTQGRFGNTRLSGDFEIEARLKDHEKGATAFRIAGTRVAFSKVNVVRKDRRKLSDWKGQLLLREGVLRSEGAVVFSGDAELELDDARPVLAVLAVNSRIARLIERAANMRDLKGQCSFALGPEHFELANLELKSSDLDLLGRLRFIGKSRQLLAFVDWRIFQIAFALDKGQSRTKIVRAREWFHQQPAWDAP